MTGEEIRDMLRRLDEETERERRRHNDFLREAQSYGFLKDAKPVPSPGPK